MLFGTTAHAFLGDASLYGTTKTAGGVSGRPGEHYSPDTATSESSCTKKITQCQAGHVSQGGTAFPVVSLAAKSDSVAPAEGVIAQSLDETDGW